MGDNDFEILLDGKKSLARIMLRRRSDFREIWEWSIFGFNHPGINGSCSTFEEAKAEAKTGVLRLLEASTPLMPDPPEWRPESACSETNLAILFPQDEPAAY